MIEVSHKGKNSHLTNPKNSQLDPNLQYRLKKAVSPVQLIKGESTEQLTFEVNLNCEMKNTHIGTKWHIFYCAYRINIQQVLFTEETVQEAGQHISKSFPHHSLLEDVFFHKCAK